MEDTIMNSVVPADIYELGSESIVKDEPKGDVEAGPEAEGACFDVLDMVEEPFDEIRANYFSSDEEADKMYSPCDSSSEPDSPNQTLDSTADNFVADRRSIDADDVDMEEVFETIDGDPNDYEECYVAERPPSPPENPIPRGWKQVYHESGASIFVHIETNVCSLSRPYFLGTNSTKLHVLPTTPVPCLRYRTYKENKNVNVAEYAATLTSTIGNSEPAVDRVITDTNASKCPVSSLTSKDSGPPADVAVTDTSGMCPASSLTSVNSVIPDSSETMSTQNAAISAENVAILDSNATVSGSNVVGSSENPTISTENTSSDRKLQASPVHFTLYTENVLNTAKALASDADSIQFHMDVATSNPATTAGVEDAVISDSDPGSVTCTESAVTSGIEAMLLDCTSDVIMTDVSATVSDTDIAKSSIEVTIPSTVTHSKSLETTSETAVPHTKEIDTVSSDEHMISEVATSSLSNNCDTMISVADSVASTSSTTDAIASALPTAPDTTKATSPTENLTASTSNAAAPDDVTRPSAMDTETTLTHNDADDSERKVEEHLLDYCKRLFKFKKIKYLKFRSWDVRRTYLRTLRNERNRRRCPFSNNKFVSFPIETKDDAGKVVATKKWIINPRGRSYVAILHEYLQQSKKTQPEYKFTEVDNARNPYAATVVVNGTEYGTGFGMSKKEAKFEAAKATLEVLLPKMMKYMLSVCCDKTGTKKDEDCSDNEDELQNVASAFDDIEITDPRVTGLSLQTTEPKPYELLLNCLKKKGEKPDVKFDFQAESMESTMTAGENQVTVKCGNKREGKQLAAQSMLQLLHPHIKNWGSLLRLYGNYITNQYRQVTDDKDVEELKCKPANKELLDTLRRRMTNLTDLVNQGSQVSSEHR